MIKGFIFEIGSGGRGDKPKVYIVPAPLSGPRSEDENFDIACQTLHKVLHKESPRTDSWEDTLEGNIQCSGLVEIVTVEHPFG